jgi:hypothetical protein
MLGQLLLILVRRLQFDVNVSVVIDLIISKRSLPGDLPIMHRSVARLNLTKFDDLNVLLFEELSSHFFFKFVVSLGIACDLSWQVFALFLSRGVDCGDDVDEQTIGVLSTDLQRLLSLRNRCCDACLHCVEPSVHSSASCVLVAVASIL